MKKMLFYTTLLLLFYTHSGAEEVGITKEMPSVTIEVNGKRYTIEREKRPDSYLTNTYARTSRPSPPFFIQPFHVTEKVETYGELELIEFLKQNKGLFIDARLPNWYEKSAIPGAVNIPFKIFLKDNIERDKMLKRLGVTYDRNGNFDFSDAKTILLYCNGPWCGQSPTAIRALIKLGYPEEKIKYYRGGMQAWQLLGLTTIVPQKDQK